MTSETRLISAVSTLLTPDYKLDADGCALHFELQLNEDIDGVLVAGSMGAMQLLRDGTYLELIHQAVERMSGKVELLVGVGDLSLGRTIDRIQSLPSRGIDGVVVLAPYMYRLSQEELFVYYQHLAEISPFPVFLYDLPAVTRNKISDSTVRLLAESTNIAGVKCSDEFSATQLILDLHSAAFRVVVAQPRMLSHLISAGVQEHLDGVFALAPRWVVKLRRAIEDKNSAEVKQRQAQIDSLLDIITGTEKSVHAACSALLNLSGVSGNAAPKPFASLSLAEIERLQDQQIVRDWLKDHRVGAATGISH